MTPKYQGNVQNNRAAVSRSDISNAFSRIERQVDTIVGVMALSAAMQHVTGLRRQLVGNILPVRRV